MNSLLVSLFLKSLAFSLLRSGLLPLLRLLRHRHSTSPSHFFGLLLYLLGIAKFHAQFPPKSAFRRPRSLLPLLNSSHLLIRSLRLTSRDHLLPSSLPAISRDLPSTNLEPEDWDEPRSSRSPVDGSQPSFEWETFSPRCCLGRPWSQTRCPCRTDESTRAWRESSDSRALMSGRNEWTR